MHFANNTTSLDDFHFFKALKFTVHTMPREIIQISIGQCGNQMGHIFWKRMLREHNLRNDGYFNLHDNLTFQDLFKLLAPHTACHSPHPFCTVPVPI